VNQSVGENASFLSVAAPCKINLHLSIGKRRDDGFHGLESIVAALDFADTLSFLVLPGKGAETALVVEMDGPLRDLSQRGQFFPPIPVENNLVYRAVELFRSKTGFLADLTVRLIKRVPPGSGLGGGSSNAAAALLALNELSGGELSRETLLDLAVQLGSDVPFFLEIALPGPEKSPALAVSGRGETLRVLPPPPFLGVLLVFPGFASHTGAAYSLLDERRPILNDEQIVEKTVPLNGSWPPPETWNFSNDFQELFLHHGSEQEKCSYQTILEELKEAGAAFWSLSGSGSACFGIFSSQEEAERAQKKLSRAFYTVQNTFFLRKNQDR